MNGAKEVQQTRDLRLDFLRAAAMLYIICVEHLDDYTKAFTLDNPFTRVFTISVLGLFVLMSGLLLSRRYDITSSRDVIRFYARRAARIYPMYLVAVVGFVAVGITTPAMALKGVLCLNVVTGSSPGTLWFAELILWFYLLAPLLMWRRLATFTIPAAVAIVIVFYLASFATHGAVDIRLAVYAPAFCLGILLGRGGRSMATILDAVSTAVASVLALAFLVWVGTRGLTPLELLAFRQTAAVVVLPLFLLSGRLAVLVPARALGVVSSASFGAFLLHRVVFRMATWLYQPGAWWDSILYLLILYVPVIYALGWGLQQAANRVVRMPYSRKAGAA